MSIEEEFKAWEQNCKSHNAIIPKTERERLLHEKGSAYLLAVGEDIVKRWTG